MSKIILLALETSADETSAAVFSSNFSPPDLRDRGRLRGGLLSNIVYSQIKTHRKTGGIVPEVAARAHLPKILPVIRQALANAGVQLNNIDYVAVTAGPGLITSLRIGVDTAKALAFALRKPIIPVNHMEGHLLSALASTEKSKIQISNSKLFPGIGLTVSGGHTQIVLIKDFGKYKILGQTLDDAAGECFDKVAKLLGLAYPGGPAIAKLAKQGQPTIDFPRPMMEAKNYNFSFAGLKTAVLYFYNDVIARSPSAAADGRRSNPNDDEIASPPLDKLEADRNDRNIKANIAASLEQAIIDVLISKTLRAAKEFKAKTILLGGGVSANQKLRRALAQAVKKNLPTSDFRHPTSDLTTDNAGMIAVAAFYHALFSHVTTYDKVKADPNWELKSWR